MTLDRRAWAEPGAELVAPGVHRVPLPLPQDGLRAINVYVLETPTGLVLVDGGWSLPESRAQLVAGLEQLGATLSDVRRFLVTHVHRDHYTQAAVLGAELGVPVGLGLGEKPTLDLLQDADRSPLLDQVLHLRVLGAAELAASFEPHARDARVQVEQWRPPDEWLVPGGIDLGSRVLEAVETPGHTRGHLVFHDVAGGLLLAGDHVLPTITPSIGFEPVMSPDPLGAFLHSLAVVRARPDALLLPAHGPVAPSVHARVDELVAHHGRRLDASLAAVHAGASSAREVAERLGWTRRETAYADLDPFNAMLATFETAAHLDLLAAQGRLVRTEVDGVRRYT